MTPTVSVIIPTFNRAHFIGEAIESVLAQTYTDFELIVVDDGSTDGTDTVVASFGDRVRYIRIPHAGVGRARNVGEQHARGKYVLFLDSDDRLYPYALELETRVLDNFPGVAFVCAEMSSFDDRMFQRYHLKTYHSSAFRNPTLTYETIFESSASLEEAALLPDALLQQDPSAGVRRAYFGNIFKAYLLNLVVCQNSVMMRRAVSSAIGPRDDRIRHWEIVDQLLRVCRHHRICFVDVPTYMLRYHEGQLSTTARPDGKAVWLRKQWWLLRVIKRNALSDAAYYQRHRRELDVRLAHLHRAVAVPLMVSSPAPPNRSYARRARVHLQRCSEYGVEQRLLWALTFLPHVPRTLGVVLLERYRRLRAAGWTQRHRGNAPSERKAECPAA